MNLPCYRWIIFLALAAASASSAAEITGKVRDASGEMATVAIEGDALPAVGDSVEIFFKLANEDVSVASGKVAAVEAKLVKVKIESATGTVTKDQLARIKSGSSPTTAGASPSPASASPPGPTSPSIIGNWVGDAGRDGIISLSFKADGTLLWMVEDEKERGMSLGKYRLNPSTKPQSLEVFDFEDGPLKGGKLHGSFEFQSDGRLKLEFDEKEPPKVFTKEAVVFSKATSPIVRPYKPYVAPASSPDEKFFVEGQTLYERKEYDGAIEAYTKAISLNPKNAVAYNHRGNCFVRKGDTDAAIADYEKAMELNPSFSEILNPLVISLKATRSAERDRGLSASPTPATTTAAPVTPPDEKLVDEGYDLYHRKDYDGAIKAYTKAIQLNPKSANAFVWRGHCYFELEDKSAALADYEKALELDPTMHRLLRNLIDAIKQNQSVDAKLSGSPTAAADEALITAGKERYDRGDYAGAMEALEKAIVLNPKNARAYHYRGLCFHRKKEWTPALADFQKAMKLDPSLDLQDEIHETRLARLEESELTASPTPAAATPARSRKKAKFKP